MIKSRLGIPVQVMLFIFPWFIRRILLEMLFGYKLKKSSRIGFSIVLVTHCELLENSRIGHLNVIKGLESLRLESNARLGRGNWITAFPKKPSRHFQHIQRRHPSLTVGEHSAITNRHIIDCTENFTIGRFSTFAGFQSQVLTHSIDLYRGRQNAESVSIGDYCFVGTGAILLPGSALPDCSVLAAGSVLQKAFVEPYTLYGGVPAKSVKRIDQNMDYFSRSSGFVY